jgi:hypothetical protein
MPRATSVKNGLAMSSRIAPTVVMVPARSVRAEPLGTNDSASIAWSTRSRVGADTRSGRFSTFETVPSETPACRATSLMLVRRGPRLVASARPEVVVTAGPPRTRAATG